MARKPNLVRDSAAAALHVQGLQNQQIAQQLGITRSTVAKALTRQAEAIALAADKLKAYRDRITTALPDDYRIAALKATMDNREYPQASLNAVIHADKLLGYLDRDESHSHKPAPLFELPLGTMVGIKLPGKD